MNLPSVPITAEAVQQVAQARRRLTDLHEADDAEGLFDYLQSTPTPLIWNECFEPFPLGDWAAWAYATAIGKRIKKVSSDHAKNHDLPGFHLWLTEHASELLKVEVWFLFTQSVCAGKFHPWVTPTLSRQLLDTLPPSDVPSLLRIPTLWTTDDAGDAILRTMWDILSEDDRRALLPVMINKAAIGQRLATLDEWAAAGNQMGVPVAARDYTGATRSAAVMDAEGSVRKLLHDHQPDIMGFLDDWITGGDEALADEFLAKYLSGENFLAVHQILHKAHPEALFPLASGKITATSRQLAAEGLVRSPMRSRSRP